MKKNIKINSSSANLALLDIFEAKMKIKKVKTKIIEKQCNRVLDSDDEKLLKKNKNTNERKKYEKS